MIVFLGDKTEKGTWKREKRELRLSVYHGPSTFWRLSPSAFLVTLKVAPFMVCRYWNQSRPDFNPSWPLANYLWNQSWCYCPYPTLFPSEEVKVEGQRRWHLTWVRKDNKVSTVGTWAAERNAQERARGLPMKQSLYFSLFPGYSCT